MGKPRGRVAGGSHVANEVAGRDTLAAHKPVGPGVEVGVVVHVTRIAEEIERDASERAIRQPVDAARFHGNQRRTA